MPFFECLHTHTHLHTVHLPLFFSTTRLQSPCLCVCAPGRSLIREAKSSAKARHCCCCWQKAICQGSCFHWRPFPDACCRTALTLTLILSRRLAHCKWQALSGRSANRPSAQSNGKMASGSLSIADESS